MMSHRTIAPQPCNPEENLWREHSESAGSGGGPQGQFCDHPIQFTWRHERKESNHPVKKGALVGLTPFLLHVFAVIEWQLHNWTYFHNRPTVAFTISTNPPLSELLIIIFSTVKKKRRVNLLAPVSILSGEKIMIRSFTTGGLLKRVKC